MNQIALLTNFTFVPCKLRSLLGEIWKLPIRRGQREWFERQAISDGLVAGWISKGTSLWGLSWTPREGWISTPPARIFKVLESPYWDSVVDTIQMGLTAHCSAKAVSLKTPPSVGRVGTGYRAHLLRTGEGWRASKCRSHPRRINLTRQSNI